MDQLIYNFKDKYKRAPITMILIILCVIVYIVSVILYGLEMTAQEGIQFGGYNPQFVFYNHDYYRLLTANFIHFGFIHIAVNCYSLYGIGMFIETVLKDKKYLIVLVASCLATTGIPYLLYLFNDFGIGTVSGGISGVIFGLIGALAALALKYKEVFMDVFKQLAPNVILMLLISFMLPSISMSGHISGFIGGFISAYLVISIKPKKKDKYKDLLN